MSAPCSFPARRRLAAPKLAAGCLFALVLACDIPLHAGRGSAPRGIDQQALPVGARAQPVGLGAHLPAAVVFYRGHW